MSNKNLIATSLVLLSFVAGTAQVQADVILRSTLPPDNSTIASPFAFRDSYGVPATNQTAPLVTFRGNGQALSSVTFLVTGRTGTAPLTDISSQPISFGALFFPSTDSFATGWNAFEQQRPPLVDVGMPTNANWGTAVATLPGGINIWQVTLSLPAWVVPDGQLAGVRLSIDSTTFLSAMPLVNGAGNVDADWYGRASFLQGIITEQPAALLGDNRWYAAEVRAVPTPGASILLLGASLIATRRRR